MTNRFRLQLLALALIVMAGSMLPTYAQDNNQPPEGFVALFNGQDLSGWTGGTTRNPEEIKKLPPEQAKAWRVKMDAGVAKHWSVQNGELVSDGKEPHLTTEKDYADFEMWVDWKLSAKGDSGVYLRGCPQVQIWDPTNKAAHRHGADKGSGGLWNNQRAGKDPSALADKPIGEWNRMYIRMVGPYVLVKLNGQTVVDNVILENYYDRSKPVPRTGPIHLQTHGSETRFRNVFVREFPTDESADILAEIHGGSEGFVELFNGNDLSGWAGATHAYEVDHGILRYKGKHGKSGNLITEHSYEDFIVRLEFKLGRDDNSGLMIRVPDAKGDASKTGLELQILDDSSHRYRRLKPDQFHGSIYGIQAAIRGYLKPVGQWNYQEVHVIGDHIMVYLNGYLIVDAHLDQLAPNHKGAMRRSGHFGICGHTGTVEFRNIKLMVIKKDDPTIDAE